MKETGKCRDSKYNLLDAREVGDTYATFAMDMDVEEINAALKGEFRGFKLKYSVQKINATNLKVGYASIIPVW